jgi:hypothetical protein
MRRTVATLIEEKSWMGNSGKPLSRTQDLVVQELNGELLIYDLRDHRAFCLNETCALVWKACDGSKTVADIGAKLGGDDIVWLALDQLREEKLLDGAAELKAGFNGMSRREVIRKIGLGSMVALPIISAIVAPTAASAQSCLPTDGSCTLSAQCCSNCCKNVGGGIQQCKPGGGACLP